MKKIFFLLLITFQLNSFSQQNFWNESLSKINYEEVVDQPIHFKQFTLNTSNLLKQLKNAHKVNSSFSTDSTIELPNKKGELIVFKIYEKSNFAPELADKYPKIKSYIGKSLDGLSTANISYSPSQGLNIAILNAKKSTTLIKPTVIGGNTYIVFSRNEISIDNPFECEDIIAARTNNSILDTRNINDGFLRKYRVAISTTAEFSQFWLDGTETTDTERKTKVIAALNATLTRINGIFERDFSVTMELIANNDLIVYLDSSTDPYSGVSNSILQSTLDNVIGDTNYDVGHLFHFEGAIHGNAGCIACVCTSGSKGSGWTGHSAPDSDNFNMIASHEFGHQFGGWHVQSSSNCRSSNGLQEVEPGSGSTIMGYAGICPANVQSGPDDYFNYVDIRDVIQWTRNDSSCAELIASGNTAPTVDAGSDYIIPKSTPFILEGTGSDTDGDALTFCWEENDPENPNSSAAPTPTRTQGPMFRSLLPIAEPIRYMPKLTDVISGNTPVWEVLPSIGRTMDFVLTVRDNHSIGAQTASDEMTVTIDANAGPFVITSQTTTETWNVGDNINITWDVANTDQSPINTTNVDILLSIDGGLTFPYTVATNILNNGITSFNLPSVPTSTQGRFMIKATNNIFYAVNSVDINIQASEFVMNFTNTYEQACKPNDLVFNFTYNTFLSFGETTTFSAINLPTGATITFNPTSATTDNTSVQATISNTSTITLGTHNFIIKGISSSIEKNVDVSMNLYDSAIASPILANPTDGETSIDPFGILNWNSDINADTYTIDISNDANFTSIIETATISINEYQANNLDYDTTYYWRVASNNTCGTSAYSSIFSFTTFCIAPTNVLINTVLLDSATVNWTEIGNSNAWEIEIVEVGQTSAGVGVLTSTNPYTLTGLNSSTEYIVYVRSSCGSGNYSDWTISNPFTTASDFCAGDHFYDTGGVSGPYQNGENITTTIVPSTGNNTVMVTFNSFSIESGWDYLQVYDGSDTNTSLLGTFTGTTLPGPFISNNPNGTLTFKFTSDGSVIYDGWDATVECLNITCPRPSSFTTQNLSSDSLDLSWIAGDTETDWEIEYGTTGFTQGTGTLIQTTTNPYSVSGLNPNTTYDFYIRANCGANSGDDDSMWVGPNTIATLVSCPQPSNLYTNTTYNSAEISWINGNSETLWEIEYGTYGFPQGTGTIEQINSTPYTITDLDNSRSYQIYIRAICGINPGDDDSLWTGPYYFYTQNLPNPTNLTTILNQDSGEVTLNWDAANHDSSGDFETYYIYRDGALIATSVNTSYVDTLPVYGDYYYTIKAKYHQGTSNYSNTKHVSWISCPIPSDFIVSNETTSSIDLSWTNGFSETNWEIEYGFFGFNQGSGTYVQINTNPFTLTGLNHSTKYDVYLRANCDTNSNDNSNWIGPVNFSTLCDNFNTPYLDDLESFNQMNEIENCWTASPVISSNNYAWNIARYGNTSTYNTGPSQAHSGSTFFYTESGYFNNNGDIAELISPVIDISALTLPQLSFYYHMFGSDMGSLHVDVYNNGTWTNDKIIIDGEQQTSGTSPWLQQTLVLNGFSGTVQIRFRGIRGNGTKSDMAIDDIKVIEAPTCPKPINFVKNNITASTVDLLWTAGNTETNWEIEYGSIGFSHGSGTTVSASTNTITLTELIPVTSYDVYVKAICGTNPGDDDSLWIGPISFTTLCDTYSTPFTEDIEIFNGNSEIENCWTATPQASSYYYNWKISNNGTTPSSNTGPVQANSGSTYFYTEGNYGNSTDVAELISPFFDISNLASPQLSFYYHMYGYSMGSLHVDVYNNGTWTNDEIVINGQQQNSATSSWIEQTLILSAYSGDIQIRFRGIKGDSSGSDMAIDDIQVIETPSCPKPTNLNESNITESTVDLSWTADNTISNWEIEYGTTGFSQGNGTILDVNTNPITLTGLTASTSYDLYLKTICGTNPGDDDSVWVGPITFTTLCGTLSSPFVEDVEAFNGLYQINNCWFSTPTNPSLYVWKISSNGTTPSSGTGPSQANSGSTYFYTEASNGNIGDATELVTPVINISNLAIPQLSFYYHMYGYNMGSLHVDIYNNGTWTNDEIVINGQQQNSATSSWIEQILSLNTYSGDIQIRFRGIRGSDFHGDIAIDDIQVIETPTCSTPTNFITQNILYNSIDLSWLAGDIETNWEVEYGTTGFTQSEGTVLQTTTNPYTLTGLNPNTTYDFYLRANCGTNPGDDDSLWIGPISATTLVSCYSPYNIITSNITNNSANISWSIGSSETSWEIEYGLYGFTQGDGTLLQTTTNPFTLTGLNSESTYDIYIKSICGSNPGEDDSLWVGPISFTTSCNSIDSPFIENFESFNSSNNCWSIPTNTSYYVWRYTNNGSTPSSNTGPSQANSGSSYYYTEASNGNSGSIAELITPIINISNLVEPQLSFYYHMYGNTIGSLHVDVFNNGNWDSDKVIINGQQQVSGSSPWKEQNLILTAYTGEIKIRFRGIKGDDYTGDIAIDDIQVTEVPSCPKPTNFITQNVSYNSLDLSWLAGDVETNWEIEYGVTGFTQSEGTLLQTTTNPISISGLNPNTAYDFYLRANCGTNPGDDDSLWVGPISTVTLVSCNPPTNIDTSNTTYNSVAITWLNGDSESNWEIEYGLYGFSQGNGTIIQTTTNSYTITGLESSRTYQMYIRSNCGSSPSEDDSIWVGPSNIYTQNLPAPNNLTTILSQDNGEVTLNWDAANYDSSGDFVTYYIYRGGGLLTTSTTTTFIDTLPTFGNYNYYVTAKYTQGESNNTNVEYVLWESCPPPTDFIATNETITSIDLTWINGYTETNWEIEYGLFGFNQGSGTYVQTNTNPFTLTGLNHSSKYDIYIRANCGINPNDDSNWVGPITTSTLCDTFITPYLDNVENQNGTYVPNIENCWTAIPNNTTNSYHWTVSNTGYTPSSYTGPSHANSGYHYFYTESGYFNSGDIAELITPVIDISTLTLPQLSFYYYMYGDNMGSLHVDLYNNGTWTDDIYIIDGEQHTSGIDPWTEQTIILDGYTGEIQIRFRSIRGNGTRSDMAIDDIQVTEAPSCPKPNNFTLDNVAIDTASFNWNIGYTETNWEIEYGLTGFSQGTGTTIQTTTNSHELSGLTNNTNYEIYLRAICDIDDNSQWIGPLSFTTLINYCDGTHFYDTGGANSNYSNNENTITTIAASDGNNAVSVDFNSFNVETCCDYLKIYDGLDTNSPLIGQFTTNPGTIISSNTFGALTFEFHSDGSVTSSGWDATVTCLDVCIQPSNFSSENATASTIDLSWIAGDSETAWEIEYGISGFTQGSGTILSILTNPFTLTGLIQDTNYDIYLRANCGTSPNENDSLWVGPISFTTLISCPVPSNLNVSNETTNSVNISWLTGDMETQWEIEYGLYGFTQGSGTIEQINSNPYTITGLNSNTTYQVYLKANCGTNPGQDDSLWIGPISFTTLISCPVPTNLNASNETTNSVNISWIAGDMEMQWEIEYGLYGFTQGSGTTEQINSNPYTITGLNSNTTYQVYLKANCGSNPGEDDSLWIGPISFTTLISCQAPTFIEAINISEEFVELSWTPGETETAWEIEYGLIGFTQGSGTFVQVDSNPFILTGLVRNTTYDVYLRAICGTNPGDDDSSWIRLTFKTSADYCNIDHFYDYGGENVNYPNNLDAYIVINPSEGYDNVTVQFNSFHLEDGYDFLYIYDGPDLDSPLLGTFTGSTNPGSFTSTHSSGALTFWLTSDGSVNYFGWDATVVCSETTTINDLSKYNFNYYPNPFDNNINLSANEIINSVIIYSMLGQELIAINPDNQSLLTIDMSKLSVGTYFMKVEIDGKSSSMKIIKK